jgi:small subunit ribosomal protein S14
MAKKSTINRNEMVRRLIKQTTPKREALKAIANDQNIPLEERFAARLKLSEMPRNSSRVRIHNRCNLTGRPRSYYRKFKLSRIALRQLASTGQIPGMVKSSW